MLTTQEGTRGGGDTPVSEPPTSPKTKHYSHIPNFLSIKSSSPSKAQKALNNPSKIKTKQEKVSDTNRDTISTSSQNTTQESNTDTDNKSNHNDNNK